LVDKAMAAETNGLWGRAYFDLRGLTNTSYQMGDQWLRGTAEVCRRIGFETILDERPETFGAGFPMSAIAFYAGWYDHHVSGPFTRPEVEFMPGAVVYHLHSFSAHSIRNPSQYWVGPLLAKGATATLGTVDEPYLEGTPQLPLFWSRLTVSGFSLAEAACAAQHTLSWQTTVVGDPLYRPFGRTLPDEHLGQRFQRLHQDLLQRHSPWLEWSHLQVANLNLVMGFPVDEVITYLKEQASPPPSAVLSEKLAELCFTQGKLAETIAAYQKALQAPTTPLQRFRLRLHLAQVLALFTERREALDLYELALRDFPDYPDAAPVYQKMLSLARELADTNAVQRVQEQLTRLGPSATK
jgi:hypothetical protein